MCPLVLIPWASLEILAMDLPALPSDQEVFSLSANEFRFRQACYFLQMFRRSCGVQVPLGSRFLWVTYADTFLMAVASLRDVDGAKHKTHLTQSHLFRFVQVMRNLTVHHLVVTSPAAKFINRTINLYVGSVPPGAIDWEEPKLVQESVLKCLDQYENDLKNNMRLYNNETPNIDAARRWVHQNLASPMMLSDVFDKVVEEIASLCKFAITPPSSN